MSELKKLTLIVVFLIAVILLLTSFVPRIIGLTPEWGGADASASSKIGEISNGYEPWFSPIWEPPSSEIETLLFSFQAAIGSGIIGYVAGLYTGRKEKKRDNP
jgi:cobalt/nickel transport protein